MSYYVKYWEVYNKSSKLKTGACFSSMGNGTHGMDNIKLIKYIAPIDKTLLKEDVEYFINFLSELFGVDVFESKLIKLPISSKIRVGPIPISNRTIKDIWNNIFPERKVPKFTYDDYVSYVLNCNGINRGKALMYLTAFRMVDEYPTIIKEFFLRKAKYKNLQDKFKELQNLHYLSTTGKLSKINPNKDTNLGGHGLMYGYGWGSRHSSFTPITLDKFKENLGKKLKNVHDYFN